MSNNKSIAAKVSEGLMASMGQGQNKNYYEFFCPVQVLAGRAALEHIPDKLSTMNAKRPLIITDKGVRAAGLIDHVTNVFFETGIEVAAIFDDVPPDSSLETVAAITKLYRQQGCDSIIAVGGGSAIDTSKGVNILVSEGGDDLCKFSGAGKLTKPLKPFIVVPTTAGTGSEVTQVAVISDRDAGVKLPFTSYFLLPDAAVLDPRMTTSLPAMITAATAMDALTHSIESFTCIASNPISDAYATAAMKKISANLVKVLDEPSDADGRLELAQASTMAGIAFSNAMVGAVHSLGHSLGAVCHLPHGLCMNLFLPYVLEYNKAAISEKLAEVLLHIAGAEHYANTPAQKRADEAIRVIKELRDQVHSRCQLPRTLQEAKGVEKAHFEQIAELAICDASVIFNPVEFDMEDALAVLEQAWG